MLSKEIEVSRNKEEQHQAALAATKKKIDALQGELQKAKWNLADISSMKNSRILELEAKVSKIILESFAGPNYFFRCLTY